MSISLVVLRFEVADNLPGPQGLDYCGEYQLVNGMFAIILINIYFVFNNTGLSNTLTGMNCFNITFDTFHLNC